MGVRQRSRNAEQWEKGVRSQAFNEFFSGERPRMQELAQIAKQGNITQYERVTKWALNMRTFSPFTTVKKLISIFLVFCNHYENSNFSLGVVLCQNISEVIDFAGNSLRTLTLSYIVLTFTDVSRV